MSRIEHKGLGVWHVGKKETRGFRKSSRKQQRILPNFHFLRTVVALMIIWNYADV